MDSSQDAIIAKNLEGIITNWNKGAEQVYGYTAEEAIGKPITILAPDERRDETMKILARIRTGERVEPFRDDSREKRRTAPECFAFGLTNSMRKWRHRGSFDDCARRYRAKARRRRCFGRRKKWKPLADWPAASPTTSIMCWALFRPAANCCGVESPNDAAQYIDNIQEASKRGTSLTRQLLAFSRRQMTLQPRLLDLNEVVRELAKLLRPLMGDDVQVILRHGTNHPIVESDPSQLDQVVLNIAVNARDAMPEAAS